MDVLDKLHRIIKHSIGLPSLVDAYGKSVDGIRIQELYQGLEARIGNGRKNPALEKLVDVAQVEIQRTRENLHKAGHILLDKLMAVSGIAVVASRRFSNTDSISPSKASLEVVTQ